MSKWDSTRGGEGKEMPGLTLPPVRVAEARHWRRKRRFSVSVFGGAIVVR